MQAEVSGGQGFQIGHGNSQVNNFIVDQRRPESRGLPVRLPPRPAVPAGREELLADIDARPAAGPEPGVTVLAGLGVRARQASRSSIRIDT